MFNTKTGIYIGLFYTPPGGRATFHSNTLLYITVTSAEGIGKQELGIQEVKQGLPIHAPFVSSPLKAIAMALAVADVRPGETLYDLGCGDGRVPIIAAKHLGSKSVCVELQPDLCVLAEANAVYNGVAEKVRVVCKDFMEASLNDADVVYAYLYTSINELLSKKYEKELREGSRIVTLDFPIPGWAPFKIRRFYDDRGYLRTVLLYIMGVSNPSSWRV